MTEPAKVYDPMEPVAITLTRRQWQTVQWALEYNRDVEKASAYQWEHCCSDPILGAETAKPRKETVARLEIILQAIAAVIEPQPAPPATDTEEAIYGMDES